MLWMNAAVLIEVALEDATLIDLTREHGLC